MPKMKTNKLAAKRVKVTARGKLLRARPGAGHLKSRKTPKQLRRFRKPAEISKAFEKTVRRLLGK